MGMCHRLWPKKFSAKKQSLSPLALLAALTLIISSLATPGNCLGEENATKLEPASHSQLASPAATEESWFSKYIWNSHPAAIPDQTAPKPADPLAPAAPSNQAQQPVVQQQVIAPHPYFSFWDSLSMMLFNPFGGMFSSFMPFGGLGGLFGGFGHGFGGFGGGWGGGPAYAGAGFGRGGFGGGPHPGGGYYGPHAGGGGYYGPHAGGGGSYGHHEHEEHHHESANQKPREKVIHPGPDDFVEPNYPGGQRRPANGDAPSKTWESMREGKSGSGSSHHSGGSESFHAPRPLLPHFRPGRRGRFG